MQDDPKLAQKVSDGQEIVGLTEHSGWQVLRRHLENGQESFMRSLVQRLLGGDSAAEMQREIDYMRGASDIAKAILRYPEVTAANLEHVAQRLYRAHLQEEAALPTEESPYIDPPEEVA